MVDMQVLLGKSEQVNSFTFVGCVVLLEHCSLMINSRLLYTKNVLAEIVSGAIVSRKCG